MQKRFILSIPDDDNLGCYLYYAGNRKPKYKGTSPCTSARKYAKRFIESDAQAEKLIVEYGFDKEYV